jgi:hypothetical protein
MLLMTFRQSHAQPHTHEIDEMRMWLLMRHVCNLMAHKVASENNFLSKHPVVSVSGNCEGFSHFA